MSDQVVKHRHRAVVLIFAALGFFVAVFAWAYSELTAQSPQPINLRFWTALMALCPPSLFSIPLIDVEPGTSDFTAMWFVIGLMNAALYGAIGLVVGICLEARRSRHEKRVAQPFGS